MSTYYLGNAWKIALGCSICRKHSIVKSNSIIKCIKKPARFTYFVIKLAKKGDLRDCNNYRGIMLLSVPSKVLNRVLLERMKEAVDPKLRDQQAGSHRNRSRANQIASLHIILEQSLEWNSPLYINFIDYEKAFDSVDREMLWKLPRHYGVPEKIITLICCT